MLYARVVAFSFALALTTSVAADPLRAPTAPYIADVELTRDIDHAVNFPARYVYSDRKVRVELVGIVTLIDLDRQTTATMIPRVRTYWAPAPLAYPAADARRWVGVEAESAQRMGTDTLLGRRVTKYRVRGTIFDSRTPFEGDVWTTAENIVVRVEGTSRVDGVDRPVRVNTVQLVVGPVDPRLLAVPANFAKSDPSEKPKQDN